MAATVLVIGAPLWLVVAVAVRLSSPGPVLHRAVRTGRDGEPFELLKFRSMRVGTGRGITAADDPRITPVGRLLRRSKLDEIPQLVNVLRGEMAIVGPRPEDPRFVRAGDPDQQTVLSVRPGLTSRATVAYRDEEDLLAGADDVEEVYRRTVLPAKLAVDAEWLRTRTVRDDVRIIVTTASSILRVGPDRSPPPARGRA